MKNITTRLAMIGCALVVGVAALMPTQAHASHIGRQTTAAAIFSGVAGMMIGAGMQKASDERHCRPRQQTVVVREQRPQMQYVQTQTRYVQTTPQMSCCQKCVMKDVLRQYNPNCHMAFIEYVTIDLAGTLTRDQQQQLVDLLNQKRCEMTRATPICCG